MPTELEVANMALSHIGARDSIPSLSENSIEARQCNRWIGLSRQMTLESYNWNFARKRSTLTAHADDPPEGLWSYRFALPSDLLKAREIQNPGLPFNPYDTIHNTIYFQPDAVPFEVALSDDGTEKTLLTDITPVTLVYTADIADYTLFSAEAVIATSYALAHLIALKITGKTAIVDLMAQRFFAYVRAAAMHDANEQVERAPRDAPSIRGRM